jgi:hypothetical protein
VTDSLNHQLLGAGRVPTPEEASRLTVSVSPDQELAQPYSPVKPPGVRGMHSSARDAQAASEAAQRGLPPHPLISARRLREEFNRNAPYSEVKRLGYGLLWTGWTLLLAIAGVSLLPHESTVFSGLIALALAFITGRYAYRIWTWRAKRLIFFIVW